MIKIYQLRSDFDQKIDINRVKDLKSQLKDQNCQLKDQKCRFISKSQKVNIFWHFWSISIYIDFFDTVPTRFNQFGHDD